MTLDQEQSEVVRAWDEAKAAMDAVGDLDPGLVARGDALRAELVQARTDARNWQDVAEKAHALGESFRLERDAAQAALADQTSRVPGSIHSDPCPISHDGHAREAEVGARTDLRETD